LPEDTILFELSNTILTIGKVVNRLLEYVPVWIEFDVVYGIIFLDSVWLFDLSNNGSERRMVKKTDHMHCCCGRICGKYALYESLMGDG